MQSGLVGASNSYTLGVHDLKFSLHPAFLGGNLESSTSIVIIAALCNAGPMPRLVTGRKVMIELHHERERRDGVVRGVRGRILCASV